MPKADVVEHLKYRIYDRNGRLVMSSDERCRYSPREELSLIEAGHRIKLGAQTITKAYLRTLMKEGK